ncbi:auxilin-like protein 1 isoform X2 [Ipomoea triloba]|uniref:auxilin-like protein 1 isoform X1 n=1 Tax=Ipomoea triloba TaxID=35885 RepID=UPI00125DE902|nr:auxilin-like protein 1 isoform X1 [Ipomoea triloba]XP_031094740.1 auxilin-like protein 1 isoform X2 [Ipomoea triloba]
MENLSHSYSKRSYHNANGFTATASKSAYDDDVFGGRTKLNVPTRSPRLEDYTEVFGGFHSSRPYCIPILDLPVAGNGEVEFPFDLRPSRFDYSEIFGGFRAVDFAVSYEDLLRQSSDGYDSSDEAWSPSPSELLSDEFDPLACSEDNQGLFSSDKFFTLTDINLRTKPSQLPPSSRPLSAFGIKSDQSDRPNSSSKGSADYAFERISGETSPPSFGEEVDTSSPTAALKDAIARAQEKCQRAKESMEKKKQGLQSCKGHSDNISTEDVTNGMFDETPEGEEKEEERGALKSNMKENQLKESIWLDKIDKKSKQGNENNIDDIVMDLEHVQNKRDQDLACKREDEDKEMQDMFKWDQTYKHFTVKNEEPEEQNVNHEKEESKGGESEVRITKIPKQVQEEERFSLASESESENISEYSDELEEIEGIIVDGCKLEELDENASYNEQITIDCESGEALDRACVSNDETVHVPLMHEKVEKIFKNLETTQATFSCDKNEVKIIEGYNAELESEIGANNLLARERLNSFTDKEENMQYGKSKVVREVARKPPCLDAHFKNAKDVVNGMENSSFKREKIASEMACHSENLQTIIHEGQNRINVAALQFTIYKEVDNEKFARHQLVRDGAENQEKIRDALSVVQEDGEILSRIDKRSTNYCRGRKEMSSNECRNVVEQKFEILKKEKEPKNEYLRKIEAEREREREREKDLMAVSLNTLEKSYAEANGKIERAASEMWQRGTANVKKLVKASTEVGLRAEPAVVERATAEAQQRASEKATAEKTAHDTRERVDTLSSHRFHTSSDNTLMGQDSFSTDLLEHKNHGKSKLRYSYSSANAGIEGESPQRCKARLERYQRTAERAAKALAEKNMRDLLAQRERVERNRLAETLDAEVKRWSSGKEGNLRALLSTLQYILGPESSWHPIPLTEVITSAAVKKAFRKATLCVHPDKLQQRGASIQQKYICEKVFDLLKDAWNKFTSEER